MFFIVGTTSFLLFIPSCHRPPAIVKSALAAVAVVVRFSLNFFLVLAAMIPHAFFAVRQVDG